MCFFSWWKKILLHFIENKDYLTWWITLTIKSSPISLKKKYPRSLRFLSPKKKQKFTPEKKKKKLPPGTRPAIFFGGKKSACGFSLVLPQTSCRNHSWTKPAPPQVGRLPRPPPKKKTLRSALGRKNNTNFDGFNRTYMKVMVKSCRYYHDSPGNHHLSHTKKKKTALRSMSHPGCFIGILIMVYCNPHITG